MKRQLLITIDAGEVVCQGCDWHKGDDEDGECLMFSMSLTDGVVRDPKCLKAEEEGRVRLTAGYPFREGNRA